MANDFKAFATTGGANVVTQVDYAASAYVSTGRSSGILPSNVYNKIARQSSIAAYLLGQLIVEQTGLDALDNGDLTTLLSSFRLAIQKTPAVASRTVLPAGSGNYSAPANCRQLKIRMIAGGGGGGALTANIGAAGGTSSFNSITAVGGGGGGQAGTAFGGTGGTGGTGTASLRIAGGDGEHGTNGGAAPSFVGGGHGGGGVFGGGGDGGLSQAGKNGKTNSGGGGGGAGPVGVGNSAAGAAAGEYVEIIINTPSGSYPYIVGASGTGGGSSTSAGGNGGSGVIIIDEFY